MPKQEQQEQQSPLSKRQGRRQGPGAHGGRHAAAALDLWDSGHHMAATALATCVQSLGDHTHPQHHHQHHQKQQQQEEAEEEGRGAGQAGAGGEGGGIGGGAGAARRVTSLVRSFQEAAHRHHRHLRREARRHGDNLTRASQLLFQRALEASRHSLLEALRANSRAAGGPLLASTSIHHASHFPGNLFLPAPYCPPGASLAAAPAAPGGAGGAAAGPLQPSMMMTSTSALGGGASDCSSSSVSAAAAVQGPAPAALALLALFSASQLLIRAIVHSVRFSRPLDRPAAEAAAGAESPSPTTASPTAPTTIAAATATGAAATAAAAATSSSTSSTSAFSSLSPFSLVLITVDSPTSGETTPAATGSQRTRATSAPTAAAVPEGRTAGQHEHCCSASPSQSTSATTTSTTISSSSSSSSRSSRSSPLPQNGPSVAQLPQQQQQGEIGLDQRSLLPPLPPLTLLPGEIPLPPLPGAPTCCECSGSGSGGGRASAARPTPSTRCVCASLLPRPRWAKEAPQASLAQARDIASSATVERSGFIRPVDKVWETSSGFGPRWGRHHNGVDLAAPVGAPVLAADAGTVTFAGWEPSGFGYLVEITHKDGWVTLYAHNSEVYAWEGLRVDRGECIASVGATGRVTGPHLHWEIRNKKGVPVDPAQFIQL
eukprot:jgi/Mesen1/7148/ME000037S06507